MKKNFWQSYFELIALAMKRAKENPAESYVVGTSILFGWIFILTSHEEPTDTENK